MGNFPPMMAPPPSAEHYPGYSGMPMPGMTDPYYGMQMGTHTPPNNPPPTAQASNSIKIEQKEAASFNHSYSYRDEPINPKPKKYNMSEEIGNKINKV